MSDLAQMNIVVTRPEPQGLVLCDLIKDHGGQAFFFPTIAFTAAPDQIAFKLAITKLHEQDWVIFISPQAVYASIKEINKIYSTWPEQVKIAAIGKGTALAVNNAGLPVALQPEENWHSEGFLQQEVMQIVKDQRIAIIRGVGGRELIDKTLYERGAKVTSILAYERVLPSFDSVIMQQIVATDIHAIVTTSFEGVTNLKKLFGEIHWEFLKKTPLLVMSERIKLLAEDLGFQTIWVTPQASNEAIVATLISHSVKRGR